MGTRQSLVIEEEPTQTIVEQSLQSEDTDTSTTVTTSETTSDKKKSLKDTMKEKAKKLKKFIGTKSSSSSSKKQKDVCICLKKFDDILINSYSRFVKAAEII